jgi:hypothetical protein
MANVILTPDVIAKEGLMILENNLVFAKMVNRKYDNEFAKDGAKVGTTVRIRKPNRFTVSNGAALSIQDITDPYISFTVNTQSHVDTNFTSLELTMNLNDFSENVLQPKMVELANDVDYNGLLCYRDVHNVVGTPGTTPATTAVILAAGQRLNEEGSPLDGTRSIVVDPAANAALVEGTKGLFNPTGVISNQYESGNMGPALGFKFSMDQNVRKHTTGQRGGTPLVNAATTANGATTLVTDGWTAAAANRLKQGDVFTIANVYAVNPRNRASTGQLRQFVVTADAASDGAGNSTLSIYPSITYSGAYATVDSMPADNAALTVVGAASTVYPQNLAFLRDAFSLVTVDLIPVEKFGAWGSTQRYKGISMRMARQYRIGTDDVPTRIDILYGYKTVYPELAARIVG